MAPEARDAWWVVDGQQRLTALTVALSRPVPLPHPPQDPYVVYFDPTDQSFQRPASGQGASPDWVPLPHLLDALAQDLPGAVELFLDERGGQEFPPWSAGNADAHLKNWSLLYPDAIRPEWSPLYDQVCTIAWLRADRKMGMSLADTHHFREIDGERIRRLAFKARRNPDEAEEVVADTLSRLRSAWPQVEETCEMPAAHVARLREHWDQVPLLKTAGGLPG